MSSEPDASQFGVDNNQTSRSEDAIRRSILDNLFFVQKRLPESASSNDLYLALAITVRDRLVDRWINTLRTYQQTNPRTVCYFSAEYLPGPFLGSHLLYLGITEEARRALAPLGVDLDQIVAHEEEPGLGNGGLGRLAACYMDSLATLEIPAIGYGLRYEYGIFRQQFRHCEQVEIADTWLRHGNPWGIRRSHIAYDILLGGRTEWYRDEADNWRKRWLPEDTFRGVAMDTPIPGYGVNTVSLLRLWTTEACEGFDLHAFNRGDYYGAVTREVGFETVSKVLYPNDEPEVGKRLRLLQQHCFVSCSLQDMIRIHQTTLLPLERFHEKFCVQLNDTHPAIAVAELMRLLVDEHQMDWDAAWEIAGQTFAYTNHTLLPEALEKWPVPLFGALLPRHLEIIYEINSRFLDQVRQRFPDDEARLRRLSIIDEEGPRYVRMAHLACVGSFAINGVAELHSRLLKESVLVDFFELWPEKFQNKTNGVTPRRFLTLANPGLASLVTDTIGPDWQKDLTRLRALAQQADDEDFQRRWQETKHECKNKLARTVKRLCNVELNPDSLFDVQAKRIHEYKRQHLNVLHILTLYQRIKQNSAGHVVPRSFIFGGKAAPGYFMAKLIIRLINAVAEVINHDDDVAGRLRIAFLPNFSVKLGQELYPAADLSEQISTAGKEASGTGNMKFSMNGALTIGTLDGANVEIREEVGADNFFLFGLTADEVAQQRASGYHPRAIYEGNEELRSVIDLLGSGLFSGGERGVFQPIVDNLLHDDPYFLLADYPAYIACQDRAAAVFENKRQWTKMSILNVAHMGKFSSDRSIADYCRDIWRVAPVKVEA